MDFFEHQERARRQSGRLVGLFLLAVAGVVGSIYFVVVLGMRMFVQRVGGSGLSGEGLGSYCSWFKVLNVLKN